HRGYLRRDGAARRWRVLGQGSVEGGPVGGVCDAVGGQERGGRGAGVAGGGAGGVRDREGVAGGVVRGDLRHRDRRPGQDPGCHLRRVRPAAARKGQQQPAALNPIARIVVDVPLAHLDRTFDYQVPDKLDEAVVPGCRVRVRFAGQLVDGYVLERAETTEHTGRLAFLERVTSSEPVLSPRLAALARAVAERYGGTLIDVLRLAMPPPH